MLALALALLLTQAESKNELGEITPSPIPNGVWVERKADGSLDCLRSGPDVFRMEIFAAATDLLLDAGGERHYRIRGAVRIDWGPGARYVTPGAYIVSGVGLEFRGAVLASDNRLDDSVGDLRLVLSRGRGDDLRVETAIVTGAKPFNIAVDARRPFNKAMASLGRCRGSIRAPRNP